MKEIKAALLGFGGIAKSHKKGYDLLAAEGANVRLVAVCDINPENFKKLDTAINLGSDGDLSLGDLRTYTDCDEMLANEEIDMVDICLPTYLHKEYTDTLHISSATRRQARSADSRSTPSSILNR